MLGQLGRDRWKPRSSWTNPILELIICPSTKYKFYAGAECVRMPSGSNYP
jgi:hypothetical protein